MTEITEQLSEPLLTRSFDEAMKLAETAARYLEQDGQNQRGALSAQDSSLYACETMRMTTQLMQVISWLLTQRAVMNGEITAADSLTDQHVLGARELCLADPVGPLESLPAPLQAMLAQSSQLYRRVMRWEDKLRDGQTPANPVGDMLARLSREASDEI